MTELLADGAPESAASYAVSRFNAAKHGILSEHLLLPWESRTEYEALLETLVVEHTPSGPTETHLVEELAGVIWRKQRVRQAEAAAHQRGVRDAIASYRETSSVALVFSDASSEDSSVALAIRSTPEDVGEQLADIEDDKAQTLKALKILQGKRTDMYTAALRALREDTREWWTEELEAEGEEIETSEGDAYTADAQSLRRFIQEEVLPILENQRDQLLTLPVIRDQALKESFDPGRMESLARYEVHLDRKFERTLAMLVRLRNLRQSSKTP
ncbi:MAG: hypothetical protein AAGA21_03900 [Pseudomonadota bacterium]